MPHPPIKSLTIAVTWHTEFHNNNSERKSYDPFTSLIFLSLGFLPTVLWSFRLCPLRKHTEQQCVISMHLLKDNNKPLRIPPLVTVKWTTRLPAIVFMKTKCIVFQAKLFITASLFSLFSKIPFIYKVFTETLFFHSHFSVRCCHVLSLSLPFFHPEFRPLLQFNFKLLSF